MTPIAGTMTDGSSLSNRLWTAALVTGPLLVVVFAILSMRSAGPRSELDIRALTSMVEEAARAVDAYTWRLVREMRAMASMPHVRTFNAFNRPVLERFEITRLEQTWINRFSDGTALRQFGDTAAEREFQQIVHGVLRNGVSDYFKEIIHLRGVAFREILLADSEGRLIAASGLAENYDQHKEQWWQEGMAGSGACSENECVFATDVEYDASIGAPGFALAVQVLDSRREPIGVLKTVVDPREIEPLVAIAGTGHPVRLSLVRRDGTSVLRAADDIFPGDSRKAVANHLGSLLRDQQVVVKLGMEEIPVRALSGPHGSMWAIAARRTSSDGSPGLMRTTLLMAVIAVMFVVSARAYALWLGGRGNVS